MKFETDIDGAQKIKYHIFGAPLTFLLRNEVDICLLSEILFSETIGWITIKSVTLFIYYIKYLNISHMDWHKHFVQTFMVPRS